jgi:hypothetical protein
MADAKLHRVAGMSGKSAKRKESLPEFAGTDLDLIGKSLAAH